MEGGSNKGKAKVENWMSNDTQEPLPTLNKDEEVSNNGSTVSCFIGENTTQLIHQPSDHVALANPSPRVGHIMQGFGSPNANINSTGTNTSSGVVGDFSGDSQGKNEVRGEDGTIDLLSKVGMCGEENEKSDGKDGNEHGKS